MAGVGTTSGTKDQAVLIVGAGTFGLATALELAEHGYRNITVLDRAAEIPSPFSAGNDFNKILRAEYEDPFYTDLALEAFAAWRTPFYAPYYREVGMVIANSAAAKQKERDSLLKSFSSIETNPKFPSGALKQVRGGHDVRAAAPQLTGSMDGWTGYHNKFAGYARAGKALKAVFDACKAKGVRFILGEQDGHAESLLFDGDVCLGVRSASGREYRAERTIICLGAHVVRLLPAMAHQITAKAWAVAHLQLTPAQAQALVGLPVINCRDLGFLFEPDSSTGMLKLCAHSAGMTNYENVPGAGSASVPVGNKGGRRPGIPRDDEEKIRKLVAATMPELSSLPLVKKLICWCGDTTDSNYIIDYVPGTKKQSLMVFSGDSGHAFKMLPIAGRWARELLERGEQSLDRWKWKEAASGSVDDIHWRTGSLRDIKDVTEWVPETIAAPKALL